MKNAEKPNSSKPLKFDEDVSDLFLLKVKPEPKKIKTDKEQK